VLACDTLLQKVVAMLKLSQDKGVPAAEVKVLLCCFAAVGPVIAALACGWNWARP
jgi:hypothetical protein